MDVRSLAKLIDFHKSELFSPILLQNTSVVIDGAGFCYEVYIKSQTDFRFGGDYSDFKNQITDLLDRMAKCGIRPVFVFDGFADKNRVKSKAMICRLNDRLKAAKDALIYERPWKKVMPALIWHLLMELLCRYSTTGQPIDVIQCAGEADGVVVALANALGAPILATDSDYFLLHSDIGYIPFDKVIWDPSGNPPCLKAEIYKLEPFLKAFGCRQDLLPIFAFLCGHEYAYGFDAEITYFCKNLTQVQDDRLSIEDHQKMITVLNWLKIKSTIGLDPKINQELIIHEIIGTIHKSRKESIRDAIGHLIEIYDMAKFRIDPSKWKEQIKELVIDRLKELNLPGYLVDMYVTGQCPVDIMAIRQDQKVRMSTLVEDFSKPSVYECGLPLRLITYAILLRDLPNKSVTEISRHLNIVNENRIKEYDQDISKGFIPDDCPDLATIADMSAEQRQAFFVRCFQFTDSAIEILSGSDIPSDLSLFAFSFVYWRCIKIEKTHCQKRMIDKSTARALLLCSIANPSMFGQDSTPEFFNQPPFSSSSKWDIKHVHNFNQWQIIYMAIVWLDTVLNHPFGPSVPVEYIFNGRIAFNLCNEFTNGEKSGNDSWTFLDDKPILKDKFDNLWSKLGKCM